MKNFSYLCLVAAAASVLSPSLFGQAATDSASANPFVNGEKGLYNYMAQMVSAAAEKMPEEDYSFKPTPDVRSFGQIVGHTADAQRMFCSIVSGQKPSMTDSIEKSKTSKADLIAGLKAAIDFCNQSFSTMTDAQAAQTVSFMGREMPKLTIMSVNNAHLDEHYGNMVTYMRIKGLVPPSTAGNAKPSKP